MRAPRLAATLAVVVTAAAPLPALAHAVLLESTPSDGTELDATPERVVLLFSEPVREPRVAVVGPDGEEVADGAPLVEGNQLVQDLADLDAPGDYQVAYRVVSDDGHPVDDELTFTLAASDDPAASPTPTPSPSPATPTPVPTTPEATEPTAAESDGVPWALVAAGGALGALAVAGVAMLRRGTPD